MDSNTDEERGDNLEIIDKENDIDIARDDEGMEMNREENGDRDNVDQNDEDGAAVDGDVLEANDEDILTADKGAEGGEIDDVVEDTDDHEDSNDQDDNRDIKNGDATSDRIDHSLDGTDNVASRIDTRGVEEGREDRIDGDGDDHQGERPIDGVDDLETQTANDDSNETFPTKYGDGKDAQHNAATNNQSETQHNDNDIGEGGDAEAGGGGGERAVGAGEGDQDLKEEDVRDADDDDPGESASNRTSKISFAEDVGTSSESPRTDGDNHNANNHDSEEFPENANEQRGDEEARVPHPKSISKSSSGKKSSIGKKSKTVRVRSSKTVSSIEVDMSRIMRSARGGGDVDSDDDDDAVTRVTCTKSVDFSLPVDDEVEEELQRVIERPGSGRMSMMDEEALGIGRAATMNTPVTNDDRESFMYARSLRTPSRDGIYEHALDLINNRCRGTGGSIYSSRSHPHGQRRRKSDPPPRSAASLPATLIGGVPMFDLPNVVEHINQEPFVQQPNSYFYVAQERPLPMQPLKVWKGYRGNVYFEPMTCRKVRMSTSTSAQQSDKESSRFPSITKSNGPPATGATRTPSKSATTARSQTFITQKERESTTRGTKSALSTRSGNARQLAILDKGSVLNRMDYNTAEDIRWISGIESTGTLQIGANNTGLTGRAYRFYRSGPKHPKLRIRRGLVSHDLATGSKHAPKLGVRGGHINENGSVVMPQKKASQQTGGGHVSTSLGRGHEEGQGHRTVSQSHPSDNYNCVDPMTALREIMNRNDGHGRSKLVHILPSANYSNSAQTPPHMRAKGK